MVIYNGYCRPLKSKVDFEVSEVNAIDTSRGIKWQIKGNYESHKISVFTKESVARELEAKLIKPDFFEAHTDTIAREPKIHEVPLSQELDEPMMAFDAEEIKIYDSEELAPFSTFNAEVFDAYDNYGVMEEEEIDLKTLKSIRQIEAEMLEGMVGRPKDSDAKGGKDSLVYVVGSGVVIKVTNIFFDDEFDSLIISTEGEFESYDEDDIDDFNIKEFSQSCMRLGEFYNKFNQIFNQIDASDVSSIKIKTEGKTYDFQGISFNFDYSDYEETEPYLCGLELHLTGDDEDNDSRFNFCDIINYANIKKTFETHGDVPVYLMLIDTNDCHDMGEATKSFIDGVEPDYEIEMITGFKSQFDEEDHSFALSNLKTMEGVKKVDMAKPFFTLQELYDLMTDTLDDYDVEEKDSVTMELIGIYKDGKFGDYNDEYGGMGFGGKFITDSLYIGVEKQEAIESLEAQQDYSELKVAELKELLEERGLTKSGKKADLIARLEEDDNGGDMIDIDDATESGMALTYDELNEFVDGRIDEGEGEDYAYLSTQFTDTEGDRATTATVIVREDETDTDFIGTAVPEIPLEEGYDDWEDDEDDEDYEAEEHVIEVDEDEDSTSITYTKESESSPFTTDIGFITFHSSETSQEVGEDDDDIIPMIFDKFIPPEVWGDLKDSQQQKYITTGDENILKCPKCGLTKAELRSNDGNCSTTDPMSEAYVAKLDCPYSKHFAPMHWIDNKESNITKTTKKAMNNVYFDDDAPIEVMAAEDVFHAPNRHSQPAHDGVKSILISKAEYYSAIHSIPETVSAVESNDGTSMKLGYFESESNIVEGLFTDTLMSEDRTPTSFSAESNELPMLWAEDLNDFKPLGRDSVVMSSENYEADENSKVVDKYDYYRNIMDVGDEAEIVDRGDSVIIKNNDIMEPDNEIKSTICVGCGTEFKKVNMLDKKGMCFNCGEESINLSQLQRYKGGGIATFDESDYPNEVMIDEEEVDNYMDDDELTEDGYSMFEEDYEEWTDDYESESDYTISQPLNSHKWLIGALGLGGIAVLLVPEKISKLFKRK